MAGALCCSLWVGLYDLAYGKSFVLRLMAGALCCGLWLEFVSQLMGGAL